jgi:hypothetical protein
MGHPEICCAAEDKKCPVSYPAGRLAGGRIYGKPHARPLLVPHSRKFGYASVRMTKGTLVTDPGGLW